MNNVTELLNSIAAGDRQASERLLPLIYNELRQIAAQKLASEKPGQTLQATALVHEAYLRLLGTETPSAFRDRGHFFAAATTAMRRILIDNARRKKTQKRGAGMRRQPLEMMAEPERNDQLLALDEALKKFAQIDPNKAKLVELRYFGGLTGEQTAAVLGISTTTADRYWAYARAWLRAEVADSLSD
jgi:RNA polymerase sigma factor (TIGR02999 family)